MEYRLGTDGTPSGNEFLKLRKLDLLDPPKSYYVATHAEKTLKATVAF